MSNLISMGVACWQPELTLEEQVRATQAIEEGNVLFFPQLPFALQAQEEKFLDARYAHPKAKNISYHPKNLRLRSGAIVEEESVQLKHLMERFSASARGLVNQLFPAYAESLQIGRTSLRVINVAGRKSSYRKDDTRLHVDAFPATPNQGQRILRVFSNVNLDGIDRVWRVGESFQAVAEKFLPVATPYSSWQAHFLKAFRLTKSYRTKYDHLMLQMHDRMKADLVYQKNVEQHEIHFPAQTTWVVFTDCVSHAAMSGQHMLEQTFYLPAQAMQNPALSPLSILEKLTGESLIK